MFDYHLFFGFPVDPLYEQELKRVNPHLLEQFIQEEGEYLQEVHHDGMRYLGRHVGKTTELARLELLETNIQSILKKIVANYRYDEIPLMLFPISDVS